MKRVAGLEAKVVALKDQPEFVEVLVDQVRRLVVRVGRVDGDRAVSLAESIAEAAAKEGPQFGGLLQGSAEKHPGTRGQPRYKVTPGGDVRQFRCPKSIQCIYSLEEGHEG